jgi:hypothetical protein
MPGFWGGVIGAVGGAIAAFVGLGMVADTTHARHRGALTAMGVVLMSVWLGVAWSCRLGTWWSGGWIPSDVALAAQWHWGPMLGALLDALAVGGMGVATFRSQVETPYSERAHAWARQSFQGELWCTQDPAGLLADLRERGVSHLLDMPRAMDLRFTPPGATWQTLRLTGMRVEADPQARWVSLRLITHSRDERGKVSLAVQPCLAQWQVGADAYQALAAHLAQPDPQATRYNFPPDESGEGHPGGPLGSNADAPAAQSTDTAESRPTPDELVPALAAFEAGQHGAAVQLAQSHRHHPDAAVRADASRLCALALSRQSKWDEAFEHFHALFDLEPHTLNALQLATTSVMAGELVRGQAWYERACELNQTEREMPSARLCTNFISALDQAGEQAATLPLLDALAQQYRACGVTDAQYLWSSGLPFLEEFLRRSWALQVRFKPLPELRQWYAALAAGLDESGQFCVAQFLTEMTPDASS